MKTKILVFIAIVITMTITSCSKFAKLTSYNIFIRSNYNFTLDDEKKIQLSIGPEGTELILERTMGENENKVLKGIVVEENGKKINRIVLRAGTMGEIMSYDQKTDILEVCFEDKDENCKLEFGPNKNGDYVLYVLAKVEGEDDTPKVKYGDEIYKVVSGSGSKIFFNIKKIQKVEEKIHFPKGRKVR